MYSDNEVTASEDNPDNKKGISVTCRRTHKRGVAIIAVAAGVFYLLTYITMPSREWRNLMSAQQLDLGSFELIFCWWVAYFSLSNKEYKRFGLLTLRTFLDAVSWNRESNRHMSGDDAGPSKKDLEKEKEISIREKSQSSRDVQGIMIAIVVLLITLLMVVKNPTPHHRIYMSMLYGSIFSVGIVITLCWVLSIDMFDTIMNAFKSNAGDSNQIRSHLYREVGPFRLGAVTYGYIGHALMPIFMLMIFSLFAPTGAAIGAAVYLFLAYPYYFGYMEVTEHYEKDGSPFESASVVFETSTTKFDRPHNSRGVSDDNCVCKNRISGNWPSWFFLLVLLVPAILIMAHAI